MLIFLDLQTTGIEEKDDICCVGLIVEKDGELHRYYELVKGIKKITPLASSIHNITNEMVQNAKKFNETKIYDLLHANNTTNTTIITHNPKLHLKQLSRHGLDWTGKLIDTHRVAKHLIGECESFSLQFLRYELKLYKMEQKPLIAHHSLSNAIITKNLYTYFLESASCEEMCKLSFKNVLMQKLEFGKYASRYIEEIANEDRGYLMWMLRSISDLDEDLRYSIEYYLQGNV